jgi:hypothetical protein
MPAKGVSLHIGLNRVDPAQYEGWDGELAACEADARDMQAIARSQGFTPQLMLTKAATSTAVMDAIRKAAAALKSGDIFFLSYSGHGGQMPDTNGDEVDGKDETWVLFDRQLIDDELWSLWAGFAPGVRIVMLSDSCHSGTVSRAMPFYERMPGKGAPRYRALPDAVAAKTYRKHKALYNDIQKKTPKGDTLDVGATVLLISGCQDNQLSSDGRRNGLFTEKLRKVWANGRFEGGYRVFRQKIAALMPPTQSPRYTRVGQANAAFEKQKPFTV